MGELGVSLMSEAVQESPFFFTAGKPHRSWMGVTEW